MPKYDAPHSVKLINVRFLICALNKFLFELKYGVCRYCVFDSNLHNYMKQKYDKRNIRVW